MSRPRKRPLITILIAMRKLVIMYEIKSISKYKRIGRQ